MATPAEIANDLTAQAAQMSRHGYSPDQVAKTMRRGAECIRELLRVNAELEQAAEAEHQRHERYVNGDDDRS